MKLKEFVTLPIQEQGKIFDDTGFIRNGQFPQDIDKFTELTDIEFEEYDRYNLLNPYRNKIFDIYVYNSGTPVWLRYGFNSDTKEWFYKPKPIFFADVSNSQYAEMSVADDVTFMTEFSNMLGSVFDKCVSVFEFGRWLIQLKNDLRKISDELHSVYDNYQEIYTKIAKTDKWWPWPYLDENPGLMPIYYLVPAMYILRRRFPSAIINPESVMTIYYRLCLNKHEPDYQRYMDAISIMSIGDSTLINNIELSDFKKIRDGVMKDESREKCDDVVQKAKDEYERRKAELRQEIMEKYKVSQEIFDEYSIMNF